MEACNLLSLNLIAEAHETDNMLFSVKAGVFLAILWNICRDVSNNMLFLGWCLNLSEEKLYVDRSLLRKKTVA